MSLLSCPLLHIDAPTPPSVFTEAHGVIAPAAARPARFAHGDGPLRVRRLRLQPDAVWDVQEKTAGRPRAHRHPVPALPRRVGALTLQQCVCSHAVLRPCFISCGAWALSCIARCTKMACTIAGLDRDVCDTSAVTVG